MPTKQGTKKRLRLDEAKVEAKVKRAAGHATAPVPSPLHTDLAAVEIAALHTQCKEKVMDKVRDRLQPGTTPVDFTVHVHGAVSVGGAGTATVKQKLDTATVLALLIGVLPEKIRQKTLDQLVEKCTDFIGGGQEPVPALDAKIAADVTLDRMARETLQTRRGTVSATVVCEVVSRGDSAAKAA